MAEIILESLMVIAIGIIIYLIARALPRIDDTNLEVSARKIENNRINFYLEKIDAWFKFFMEKFLRRLRLTILKVDNVVGEKLKKLKNSSVKEPGFSEETKTDNSSLN
jgi:hypothetical protein